MVDRVQYTSCRSGVFCRYPGSGTSKLNSDYEAKRLLSLERLRLHIARPGLFNDWLKEKGKLGGQHKVPRLWNDRTHLEELLLLDRK